MKDFSSFKRNPLLLELSDAQVWGSTLTELKTEENKNGYTCRYTGPTLLAEQKTCFKKTKNYDP